MLDEVKSVVESVIGQPRRDGSGWLEYNCPYCAMDNGVDCDGKYNLALNYGDKQGVSAYFHCWKCGTSGRISKVIRDFGGTPAYFQFKNAVRNLRESGLYTFNFGVGVSETPNIDAVELPNDFVKLDETRPDCFEALDYLKGRGITKRIIEKYNIGIVPYWSRDISMKSRIVVPSYDDMGEINYFVSRDFTGKRKYKKYNNPNVPKTHFIFNEGLVNWYEDVTLVEGVFDHIVTPNSIPLLGKSLKSDYMLFQALVSRCKANVNVLLDSDARDSALKIYKLLNSTELKGRVRLIDCPNGYDPSDIFQVYGIGGMVKLMNCAKKLDEFELIFHDMF